MLIFKSKLTLAALVWAASYCAVQAAELTSVRFGSHQGFDRVVCEVTEPVEYEVAHGKNGIIELHLKGVTVGEKFFLPKLPPQIKLLTSVEAFQEGEDVIVLEIRGSNPLTANTTELKGQLWRLAMDLSLTSDKPLTPATNEHQTPSTSKSKTKPNSGQDGQVPYVPGDRPMETILADESGPETAPEPQTTSEPEPKQEPNPRLPKEADHSLAQVPTPTKPELPEQKEPLVAKDSLKALEVLAEFYDVMGDQDAARQYARLYLDKVDSGDALPPMKKPESASWPVWLFTIIAFLAGIAGGIIGVRLRFPVGETVRTGFKFKMFSSKSPRKVVQKEPDEELAEDLDSLSRAVASEKSSVVKPAQRPVEAEVPVEAVQENEKLAQQDSAPNLETEMKDSLMDRRVKRVLELHAQSRTLADIAQDLDMGQDEVKLIIDLNS